MNTLISSVFVLCAIVGASKGTCPNGCNLPVTIYNDLKCRPIYANDNDCCPAEYDCSHIYNHTEVACHFKGKLYEPGKVIDDDENTKGTCDRQCKCQQDAAVGLNFFCPRLMDGCAEYWVSGYPGPGCYLRRRPNECCAGGQICPPFDGNAKCDVNGKIYKEGEVFEHPTKKCIKCACNKGFEGKFEEPFCEEKQCYAEIKNSVAINNYCAPYYATPNSCCPEKWICLGKSGKFLPPLNDSLNKGHLKCKFGTETVDIGTRYEDDSQDGKIQCDCVVPPLMTCGSNPLTV